MHIEQCISLHI